jgi:hypothetical protein
MKKKNLENGFADLIDSIDEACDVCNEDLA